MIVYSVICRARDAAILVEESSDSLTSGNAPQVTAALLEYLKDHPSSTGEDHLKTYVHRNDASGNDFLSHFWQACTVAVTTADELDLGTVQEHYFHVWQHFDCFFCCLSDDPDPREQKVNFAFLQAVSKDFASNYTARKIKHCNARAMQKAFCPSLRSSMHYYNIHRAKLGRDPKINALMGQVEDMKSLLGRNVELMLERETQLDALLQKTEQTKLDSMVFKKKAVVLKNHYRCRYFKMWGLIALLLMGMVWTLSTAACGLRFQRCGNHGGGGGNNGGGGGGGKD